ncbi:general secretion pathway protein GspK [Thiocystis violacea]|uniref:general secretion pathway protein GspK n=1 Tax=Thiocystis violacea TaxID=13725 RepID=UPI001F5BD6C8|nr:type II secretion system protein GspK [Thiocystis violacea]
MLVMWVLTLLTVMAVSLTASQRTESSLTENHVSAARFRALADAAIAYTALHFMTQSALVEEETGTLWRPSGSPRTWSFAGSDLSIVVYNESSRYNLNQVQPEVLANLLEVLGVETEEASALAAAIVDWRDEDDLALLDGAEDADYEQAGRAIGAKDAPYEAVEELRQVLGMTQDIYRRLAPEVTVDANSGPEERFASPAVLATLRGVSLDEALEEIAERDQPRVPDATSALAVDRGGPLYRIRVSEGDPGGSGQRMEALFQLFSGQQPPYQILWRRYGVGAAEDWRPSEIEE